jgi:uncharacterized protein YhaN
MVDILRSIDPLPPSDDEQQRKYSRSTFHSQQEQLQQQDESLETEDVFVDDIIPTITASINRLTGSLLLSHIGHNRLEFIFRRVFCAEARQHRSH